MSDTTQQYEDYWKLTLEYSDINGSNFITTLQTIIDFIDSGNNNIELTKRYNKLQDELFKKFPKNPASIRKSINQFIKLGFVETGLKSYHTLAKDFLSCENDNDRQSLFSKIVYDNASFNRSVKNESTQKEVNFLIKTLEEIKLLDNDDIASLMTIADLNQYQKGYVTRAELEALKISMMENDFVDRKYNQLSHTLNVLTRLDNIVKTKDGKITLSDYVNQIATDDIGASEGRDPYLHRIYKSQLIQEADNIFGKTVCMLEYLKYPSLVASHIKPFIKSNKEEAYDKYNGLLLSRNLDGLFDKGYISFNDNGKIICSKNLDTDLTLTLNKYKLNDKILHHKRLEYLDYHRENVFKGM
jgi:putative restriction endonuclease